MHKLPTACTLFTRGTADWEYLVLSYSTMHTAASIRQANLWRGREMEDGCVRADCVFVQASICNLVWAYEYIYIFEFAYVALCLFMPVCWARMHARTHKRTRLLCVCLLLLLCLCACGRAGMEHCRWAEFTETGLVLACRAVFRLCIYASDNHSNLYHRLVIHVCLLCSVLIRFHQEVAPLPFYLVPLKLFPQKCSRHTRSEFHQPPVIGADQARSGFP